MTGILAEAGWIIGLGPKISGKIASGQQSAYRKLTGEEPTRFVASASQMADLGDDDLVVVWFSRIDHSTVSGQIPDVALFRA